MDVSDNNYEFHFELRDKSDFKEKIEIENMSQW